jgi:hypothetical protein
VIQRGSNHTCFLCWAATGEARCQSHEALLISNPMPVSREPNSFIVFGTS